MIDLKKKINYSDEEMLELLTIGISHFFGGVSQVGESDIVGTLYGQLNNNCCVRFPIKGEWIMFRDFRYIGTLSIFNYIRSLADAWNTYQVRRWPDLEKDFFKDWLTACEAKYGK